MKMYEKYFIICLLYVLLFILAGCGSSGPHDDDGDDSDGGSMLLTVDNIQGTYDLSINDSTIVDFDDVGLQAVSGTLVINGAVLSTTFVATATDRGSFTLMGNMVTITSSDGEVSTDEVAFSDNGNTLTLIDVAGDQEVWTRRDGSGASNDLNLENLQGIYELDESLSTGIDLELDGFINISTELVITDMRFEITATAEIELSETFVIDGNTIRLSDDDGEITNLTATLTETMLILVGEAGDRFVFERR